MSECTVRIPAECRRWSGWGQGVEWLRERLGVVGPMPADWEFEPGCAYVLVDIPAHHGPAAQRLGFRVFYPVDG